MTRRMWAVAILGAWAASLGWLVKREFFRPTGTRLAEAALSVPPGAVYYRLDVGGQQIGFASSTIDTQAMSIGVTDILELRIPALGVMHRTAAMSRATLSRTLRLERVDARFDGDLGRFAARSLVAGDSLLTVTLLAGPDSDTTHVPLARPIVLPTLLPLRLAFGGELKRGKTYTSVVFDPILLAERPVTVLVAAESTLVVVDSAGYDSTALAWVPARFDTVRAFRIEQREGGMTTRAWIDAQGHIVRAENAVGFVMERTAFELAYTNFRHRDTTRLIRASAAPGPGDVVATTVLAARAPLPPDTVSLFRVRLGGIAPGALDLGGGRQEVSGDTLVIRRQTPAALAARYRLPARDSSLARWLATAPLIQSDDPRLQARARPGASPSGYVPTWSGGRPRPCPAPCRCSRRESGTATSTRCCSSPWRGQPDCRPARSRDSCPWAGASTITRGPRCTSETGLPWTRCWTSSPPAPPTCASASAALPGTQSSC